jgi:hypothetical protein
MAAPAKAVLATAMGARVPPAAGDPAGCAPDGHRGRASLPPVALFCRRTDGGEKNAGRVIAWIGMAMFAALALGAPLGTALYSGGGFAGVAIATTLMPFLAVLVVAPLLPVSPQQHARPTLRTVAAAVWLPGLGAALSSIGFGAIIAFSSLLSAHRAFAGRSTFAARSRSRIAWAAPEWRWSAC